MIRARKLDSGQVQVDAECTDVPGGRKTFPFGFLVSPEDALRLARELRDAADPWSEEACIEWLRVNQNNCAFDWQDGALWRIVSGGQYRYRYNWPDTVTGLRECVHEVASKRGIDCPLGALCAICHPPAPPVPTDDELARMGTEELIRWIEESGMRMHNSRFSVHRNGFNMSAWSVLTAAGRCEGIHASSTLLGLAKIVAAQLREARHDA